MNAARLLLLASALLAVPAAAQDAPEVVVTGRGLASAPGERAYDTVVIDRAAIESNAAHRLETVLAGVAGLDQFRHSDSRSANPTSQGITLRGLGGNAASRALLILDGVPQADPFGGWVAFPAYALSRLGEVRVTRGAAAACTARGRWRGRWSWRARRPTSSRRCRRRSRAGAGGRSTRRARRRWSARAGS